MKKQFAKSEVKEGLALLILGVCLFSYSIINHYSGAVIDWQMSPYLFPLLVSIILIILSIILVKVNVKINKEKIIDKVVWTRVLKVLLLILLYFIFLPVITFIPSTIIFLAVMIYLLGEKRLHYIIIWSAVITVFIDVIFVKFFNILLP